MGCGSSKGDPPVEEAQKKEPGGAKKEPAPAKQEPATKKKEEAKITDTAGTGGSAPAAASAPAAKMNEGNPAEPHVKLVNSQVKSDSLNPFLGPFSIEADLEMLNTGLGGAAHKDLISLFCGRKRQQRLQLAEAFEKKTGESLVSAVSSKTTGACENVCVAMLKTELEFDVWQLHEALRGVKGIGTTVSVPIEVLTTRTNAEINAITAAYEKQHGKTLASAIEGDTVGSFENLLVALCSGKREEGPVDMAKVKQDVSAIYRAGEDQMGTNNEAFVRIFTTRSSDHLREVAAEYHTISTKQLAAVIDDETSGHYRQALHALLDPTKSTAQLLFDAVHGVGTDDDKLIRIITRLADYPARLERVQEAWAANPEWHDHWKTPLTSGNTKWKTLMGAIDSDTSGDYRKILRRLCCTSQEDYRAVLLHEAMKGVGTDEVAVTRILTTCHDSAERERVQASFQSKFGKGLNGALKSELSGHQSSLMQAMASDRAVVDAQNLALAMNGVGTTESVLIEILVTRSEAHIAKVKEAYVQKQRISLEDSIKAETSGHTRDVLLKLLVGGRSTKDDISPEEAQRVAKQIFDKGEGQWGTDDEAFVEIFTTYSSREFVKINQAYTAKYGHSLEKAITRETSGHYEVVLVALVNPYRYVARCFHLALHGLGTDDTALSGLVVHRTRDELFAIADEYHEEYGSDLLAAIKSDTSGGFRAALEACFN